jgi:hypothetical protein
MIPPETRTIPLSLPFPAAERPAPRFSPPAVAIRLFLTCWLIYGLHLATNTVREIYLALSIADHFSFQVTDYANMHPDLFDKPGHGWHIGANPGASMIAAIPYALCRPIVDRIVDRVNRQRAASGAQPPEFNSPWPMAREFFKESWRRGYDIKFALASVITQGLCMAPISALGVVAMFYLLLRLTASTRLALWLALLYAFGTPAFFRTGYLNHNLMIGHFTLMGFLLLWSTQDGSKRTARTRYFLAGLSGGGALLLDYSGVVFLLGLFVYGLFRALPAMERAVKLGAWYVAGTLGPVGLLWFYQWQSFGHPFYPGQHWMPPVEWIDAGYQGFTFPQLEILGLLAFDYRYGLFVTCPLFLLAFLAPRFRTLKRAELLLVLGLPLALYLFCGGISYTRLQFNTGIRYMAPSFPFLFIAAAITLMHVPRRLLYFISVFAVAQAWAMAMYRDVERGGGVLDPLLQVFIGGFKLPVLTVLSRFGGSFEFLASGVSPLPLFALTAAIVYGIWSPRLTKGKS